MCIKKSLAPSEIILTHCSPHTGQRYELSSFRAEIELEKKFSDNSVTNGVLMMHSGIGGTLQ